MNSSITLSRDSGLADRIRNYRVMVDGKEIGRIKNGETKTFAVEPGEHQILLKVDWCGSNTLSFSLTANHSVRFLCGSNVRGLRVFLALFYVVFVWRKYLWLKQTSM